MKIRIIASGDQHVDARHLGGSDALLYQELAVNELVTAAARADALLLLGDATHTSRPSTRALEIWGKQLHELHQENGSTEVIALAGNHEQDGVTGLLEQFRGSVKPVIVPRIIPIEAHGIDAQRQEHRIQIDVACLPWLPDSFVRANAAGTMNRVEIAHELTKAAVEVLRGFLAQRREGVPMILATHATIAGAQTSSGWNMGYRPSTNYVLPIEELEGFALVIAGHIHRHQALAPNIPLDALVGNWKPSIVYTGSLVPLDFSETEPKGYVAIDFDGQEISWSFVPLKSTPKIGTVERTVTDERGRGVLEALLGSYSWPTYSRFRLTCDETTAREFPASRIRAAILDAGARMAQVELNVIRQDRARDASLTDDLSPMTALEKYLEGRDVDVESIRELAKTAIADAVIDSGAAGVGDLRLARLEAENFLGLARADVDLSAVEIATLFAPVGYGKSSTGCDLVRFALFGESRIGGKASERLIRQGADQGFAAVELESELHRYRIVRTLKRGSAGRVATTLDVLENPNGSLEGHPWLPLSSGKIADGEAEISRILGGLTDDVLSVANLVVQRDADRFSSARPEERKRLIAKAAGLEVFDTLAQASQIRRTNADSEIRELQAALAPLKARADALERLEAELAAAMAERDDARRTLAKTQAHFTETGERIERLVAREGEHQAASRALEQIERELGQVVTELATWDGRVAAARKTLEQKSEIEHAREGLEEVRAQIAELEEQLDRELADVRAHASASAKRSGLELRAAGIRSRREASARELAAKMEAARRQEVRLKDSECPIIEEIPEKYAPCAFLRDAVIEVASIGSMESARATYLERSQEELELMVEIGSIEVPDAPVSRGANALTVARLEAKQLESKMARADEVARAEQLLEEHRLASERLDARFALLDPQRRLGVAALRAIADPTIELEQNRSLARDLDIGITTLRSEDERLVSRVALLEGRIETMREAAAEAEGISGRISAASATAASWALLVEAWRACRVMVLENSVIPSLEDLANEVLRQFPYGIQVALSTQREKLSGGTAETLEIEVLGAGQVYELCSGGQKTAMDTAFHIAIALLVSRRIATRLRFIYIDEPEGLDEAGRIALAQIVRWVNAVHGITVILATHHEDLIDGVGGQRIPFSGEPGNAFVGEGAG